MSLLYGYYFPLSYLLSIGEKCGKSLCFGSNYGIGNFLDCALYIAKDVSVEMLELFVVMLWAAWGEYCSSLLLCFGQFGANIVVDVMLKIQGRGASILIGFFVI